MVEFLKLVSPQVSSRSPNKNAQRCIWCNEDDLQCCCPPLKLTANAPENRPKLPQKETSFRLPFLSIFRGILETVSFREGIITNQVITTPIYIYIYIYTYPEDGKDCPTFVGGFHLVTGCPWLERESSRPMASAFRWGLPSPGSTRPLGQLKERNWNKWESWPSKMKGQQKSENVKKNKLQWQIE